MEDSAHSDLLNSFAQEREEYLKTFEELFDKLVRLEQYSREAEQRRRLEDEAWRVAEHNYLVQIQEALEFKELYNEEKRKREAIEEELARCKEELEGAN